MSHPYYQSLPSSLRAKFQDLDADDVYAPCKDKLYNPNTKNFVVDFGGAKEDGGAAWCAVDIDSSAAGIPNIEALLKTPRPQALRTRWINIFSPHTQQPLVKAIASHYGFTPRHIRVLTAEPSPDPVRNDTPQGRHVSRLERIFHLGRRYEDFGSEGELRARMNNIEAVIAMATVAGKPGMPGDARSDYNFMELVKRVWHWHSVEWGGRYICIGFNALHQTLPDLAKQSNTGKSASPLQNNNVENDESDESGDEDYFGPVDNAENNPTGIRLWSWMILCEDGTVVTLHEPLAPNHSSEETLKLVRRNIMTVFRALSQSEEAKKSAHTASSGMGLDELPFRKQNVGGSTTEETIESGPSLLFYYLYDDWYSSYPLVFGRGYPYSHLMRKLREEMMLNPQLSHISELHRLGRQLAIMKRMYETRKIIIDNVLNRQDTSGTKMPASRDDAAQITPPMPTSIYNHKSHQYVPKRGDPHVLGVPLEPLAVAKFERLRDRIQLYALGEIIDCLAEKNELASMTFNLIALRESKAVEQLTRITILLTKFTFVFLPLSLITGYFSMQLNDVNGIYNLRHFWGASGVSVFITILLLWTIGKASGTTDMGIVWQGIKRVWFGWLEGEKKKRRRKRKEKKKLMEERGLS